MMDAFKKGDEVYRVSIMVEVLANSADDAVNFADSKLITDAVVNNPRFVSFSVSTPGRPVREVMA